MWEGFDHPLKDAKIQERVSRRCTVKIWCSVSNTIGLLKIKILEELRSK
jgi:hypothetical protein